MERLPALFLWLALAAGGCPSSMLGLSPSAVVAVVAVAEVLALEVGGTSEEEDIRSN